MGSLLILLGVTLMWWADLDKLQKEQSDAVHREINSWEKLHKDSWQSTQVCPSKIVHAVAPAEQSEGPSALSFQRQFMLSLCRWHCSGICW